MLWRASAWWCERSRTNPRRESTVCRNSHKRHMVPIAFDNLTGEETKCTAAARPNGWVEINLRPAAVLMYEDNSNIIASDHLREWSQVTHPLCLADPPEFLHSAPSTELPLGILSETLKALLSVWGYTRYLFHTKISSALHSGLIRACQVSDPIHRDIRELIRTRI